MNRTPLDIVFLDIIDHSLAKIITLDYFLLHLQKEIIRNKTFTSLHDTVFRKTTLCNTYFE